MTFKVGFFVLLCVAMLPICLFSCRPETKKLSEKKVLSTEKSVVEANELITEKSKKEITNNVIYLHDVTKQYGSDEAALKALVNEYDLVVVDFYATWCQPCRTLSDVIERVAQQMRDVLFVKIDVAKSKSLAATYSVRTVPLVVLFKNGLKSSQIRNGITEAVLRSTINSVRA
jgi:thioredoxin 1